MMQNILRCLLTLAVFGAFSPALVQAQVWPGISLQPRFSGLQAPVVISHAGDGSGRLFMVEQGGIIKVAVNGVLLTSPFLNITAKVLSGGEQGLLGLAFPPNFAASRHFYVYYTTLTGDNVVARYTVSGDPSLADSTSELIILTLSHPTYTNHNGGQLAFSPNDGFLYIGTGDGGGTPQNAQDPQSLLGKILRLDVESAPDMGLNYRIPPTNPFFGSAGVRQEIWALGLRNPWRFSFDRLTGDLYIGDVGQATYEEVNFQAASSGGGENYGWNILEGPACYNPPQNCVPPAGYAPPVMYYNHTEGIAIVGGYVYRGARFRPLQGIYFFGDLNGKIWGLQRVAGSWQRRLLSNSGFTISTFGEDEAGNLYVANLASGIVYEIGSAQIPQSLLLLN
ncbi:MAG: PQQ-dependent sugar dehydrogenase [Syntrophales bacterium]|nr:PQQ-dependent sugar dehydrogenase [Syntrophales bacterium]